MLPADIGLLEIGLGFVFYTISTNHAHDPRIPRKQVDATLFVDVALYSFGFSIAIRNAIFLKSDYLIEALSNTTHT